MALIILIFVSSWLCGVAAYWLSVFKEFYTVKRSLVKQAKEGDKIYTSKVLKRARKETYQGWFGQYKPEESSFMYFALGCLLMGFVFFLYNLITFVWELIFANWFYNLHTVVEKEKTFEDFLKEAESYDPQLLIREFQKRSKK